MRRDDVSAQPDIISAFMEQRVQDDRRRDRSVGAILIDAGKLTPENAERVLRLQKETGLRFGEAAMRLGLVQEDDLLRALAEQFDYGYVMPGENSLSPELIAAFQPFSPEVESLRALRSQLMLRWLGDDQETHAIAVTSPGTKDGRSFLAANLAVVFSQLGEHTLLIDADMRNPRQHELFRIDNRTGLSAILSGRGDATAIQRIAALQDLSVLPAGAVPPNPQELLARPMFARLMDELTREFDVVILDTPPGDAVADAHTLATRAGAALLVARKNVTQVRALRRLTEHLQQGTARVVGLFVSEF